MPVLTRLKQDKIKNEEDRLRFLDKAVEVCRHLALMGAKESWIFGSVLSEHLWSEHSDVDIAVSGLPDELVYRMESQIEDILAGRDFDLVYLEQAPSRLAKRIREKGRKYAGDIP